MKITPEISRIIDKTSGSEYSKADLYKLASAILAHIPEPKVDPYAELKAAHAGGEKYLRELFRLEREGK